MNIKPEAEWAVTGLLGGFLLWYFLIGPVLNQPIKMPPANATVAVGGAVHGTIITVTNLKMAQLGTWNSPGGMSGIPLPEAVNTTNLQMLILRVWEPTRWRGFVPEQPGSRYSLDLIDDIHPEALPMPKE